jgi:serine/threonine protein kinase
LLLLTVQLTIDLHTRLSDFGSSLLIHPAHPPTDGVGLGTLPFSPPELVDPIRTFAFPVDIFALGATLYQCITGREPYRAVRAAEMMHHVRRGALWKYEERERLARIGDPSTDLESGSPYPSAWRSQGYVGNSPRRAGSLRISSTKQRDVRGPALSRMSSAESVRAYDDLADDGKDGSSAGQIWAKWVHNPSSAGSGQMIWQLLANENDTLEGVSQTTSVRPTSMLSRHISMEQSVKDGFMLSIQTYDDGSPEMTYLNGASIVKEDVRAVLKLMVDPSPEARPTAYELSSLWERIGLTADDA